MKYTIILLALLIAGCSSTANVGTAEQPVRTSALVEHYRNEIGVIYASPIPGFRLIIKSDADAARFKWTDANGHQWNILYHKADTDYGYLFIESEAGVRGMADSSIVAEH